MLKIPPDTSNLPDWDERESREEGNVVGGLNSMFFELVLRHYHPLLFLHIWLSSRNVFP